MLRENEKRVLEALKALAVDGLVTVPAKKIPVQYEKTKRVFTKVEFTPSKEAKLNTLRILEKKGYIKIDYSKQQTPKIKII